MKNHSVNKIVIRFISSMLVFACTVLNLGRAESPAEVTDQSANLIEDTGSLDAEIYNFITETPRSDILITGEFKIPAKDVDASGADGIYYGTTTPPEYWNNNSQGLREESSIKENEITIMISPNGDVYGGVIFILKAGSVSVHSESGKFVVNWYSTATLSGSLT